MKKGHTISLIIAGLTLILACVYPLDSGAQNKESSLEGKITKIESSDSGIVTVQVKGIANFDEAVRKTIVEKLDSIPYKLSTSLSPIILHLDNKQEAKELKTYFARGYNILFCNSETKLVTLAKVAFGALEFKQFGCASIERLKSNVKP